MKKIKLPRKRKKRYLKLNDRDSYLVVRILGEILQEEGGIHSDRFYHIEKVKASKEHPNGFMKTFRY